MVEEKILFVDDEETQRDVMQRVLTKKGYTVKVAKDSDEALQILENEAFPLILMDLNMPGMDGAQLCELIKKKDPNSFVIAISGYIASKFLTDNLEESGFDGWIAKPISANRLDQVVKGAFDRINRTQNRTNSK